MQDLFEFLFKYRPVLYEQGDFAFTAPRPIVVAVLLLAVGLLAVAVYLGGRGAPSTRDRILLTILRVATLGLVTFCLLQPALVLETLVPQESFLGILVDDSASMQINDEQGGTSRAQLARSVLDPTTSQFYQDLSERFKVRLFAFSESARRIESASDLGFDGRKSDLATALRTAADELAGTPNAGLLLLTDGADTTQNRLSDVLLELESRSMPVRTLPLGKVRYERDLELSRVVAPRTVLQGSALQVEVTIGQRGFSGETATLEVEDEGRIVNVQQVDFPATGEAVTVTVNFTVTEPGLRRIRFELPAAEGEEVAQNNQQTVLIEVEETRAKLLYFEGEPRYEVKFLRRAVEDDPNIQLVVLQRTAENKYLRLDVDGPDELADGFPATREELFSYRALILGSVEASFFTYEQMRMIVDFVSLRGGGLLMLGGRSAFSEGGYAGTPLADVLPVELVPAVEGEPPFAFVKVGLTPFGRSHPALQLGADEAATLERWQQLPELTTINPITDLKAGATALLSATSDDLAGEQVILAHHRYGRGRALALTVQDTWRWQMHNEIPLEDMTHETLWRQLMRWLVSYVPDNVEASTHRDRVALGDPVSLQADIRDPQFLEINNASVIAGLRSPSGEQSEVALEWTVDQDGRFKADFEPNESGIWRMTIDASAGGVELGQDEVSFEVAELADEFFGAEQGSELLDRIASETSGQKYSFGELDSLGEDLSHGVGGSTVEEYHELWNMPFIFLLLMILLGAEWAFRRARGWHDQV